MEDSFDPKDIKATLKKALYRAIAKAYHGGNKIAKAAVDGSNSDTLKTIVQDLKSGPPEREVDENSLPVDKEAVLNKEDKSEPNAIAQSHDIQEDQKKADLGMMTNPHPQAKQPRPLMGFMANKAAKMEKARVDEGKSDIEKTKAREARNFREDKYDDEGQRIQGHHEENNVEGTPRGQKGVHRPFSGRGKSLMGAAAKGHYSHGSDPHNKVRNKNTATWEHEEVSKERSKIKKPNLGKTEHQPHPGPSRSEHQKAYDAKKQAESEAYLKTPEGNAERQRQNAKVLGQMKAHKAAKDKASSHGKTEMDKSESALLKPYSSDAQRRWAHTEKGTKALGGKAHVHEWDEATKGKKLPEHVAKSEYEKGVHKPIARTSGTSKAGMHARSQKSSSPTWTDNSGVKHTNPRHTEDKQRARGYHSDVRHEQSKIKTPNLGKAQHPGHALATAKHGVKAAVLKVKHEHEKAQLAQHKPQKAASMQKAKVDQGMLSSQKTQMRNERNNRFSVSQGPGAIPKMVGTPKGQMGMHGPEYASQPNMGQSKAGSYAKAGSKLNAMGKKFAGSSTDAKMGAMANTKSKELHQGKLAELKAMPKPNLGKSTPMKKDGGAEQDGGMISGLAMSESKKKAQKMNKDEGEGMDAGGPWGGVGSNMLRYQSLNLKKLKLINGLKKIIIVTPHLM